MNRNRRTPTQAFVIAGVLFASLLSIPGQASALLNCSVEVTDVWIYSYGNLVVTVKWQEGATNYVRSWQLCSLEKTVSGVATVPAVCSDIYALLMTAKTTQTRAQVTFLDTVPIQGGGGPASTCHDVWQWTQSVADHLYFVRLKKN
jgi:hypothetical protein